MVYFGCRISTVNFDISFKHLKIHYTEMTIIKGQFLEDVHIMPAENIVLILHEELMSVMNGIQKFII